MFQIKTNENQLKILRDQLHSIEFELKDSNNKLKEAESSKKVNKKN